MQFPLRLGWRQLLGRAGEHRRVAAVQIATLDAVAVEHDDDLIGVANRRREGLTLGRVAAGHGVRADSVKMCPHARPLRTGQPPLAARMRSYGSRRVENMTGG